MKLHYLSNSVDHRVMSLGAASVYIQSSNWAASCLKVFYWSHHTKCRKFSHHPTPGSGCIFVWFTIKKGVILIISHKCNLHQLVIKTRGISGWVNRSWLSQSNGVSSLQRCSWSRNGIYWVIPCNLRTTLAGGVYMRPFCITLQEMMPM